MTASPRMAMCVSAVLGIVSLAGALGSPRADHRSGEPNNAWRGIVPLQSTAADVARVLSIPADRRTYETEGPFQVDGGEVTISYLTRNMAQLFHAPLAMVGKVFTIYFKPVRPAVMESAPARGFKRCIDDMDKGSYFFVSADGSVAYEVGRATGQVEFVIYQPSRAQIRALRVNTSCVF